MTALVALLTDFGPGSVYVGQVHAVLRALAPEARLLDLAHDCPPGDVEAASYLLGLGARTCPMGTVHLVVVDPGVGTSRAILAGQAAGHTYVGPDNGVLAARLRGGCVHRVENRTLFRPEVSSTFHGRDVMAPVAAHLAAGRPLGSVGPPAPGLRALPGGPSRGAERIDGRVLLVDRFGNLVTNVPASLLPEAAASLRVHFPGGFVEGLVRTFMDVPPGQALAYVGSGGHIEIAMNGAAAARTLGVGVGDPVSVETRTGRTEA